jgi:hypothetical protein
MGLAIVTSVFNSHVGGQLAQLGIESPTVTLAAQHHDLPAALQSELREVLSGGYNRQMLTVCGFGAAQVPAALLMWRRKQLVAA